MSEKEQGFAGLPTAVEFARLNRSPRCKRTKALVVGLCLGALGMGGFVLQTIAPKFATTEPSVQVENALCPQAKPMTPIKHSEIWNTLVEKSTTDEHKAQAIEWLSGAVRIPCVCSSKFSVLSWVPTTLLEPSPMITWSLWGLIPAGTPLDSSMIICSSLSLSCAYSYVSESSF